MKMKWIKKISILLAALLVLVILPMSAMAEKGTDSKTTIRTSAVKATASNVQRKKATPSNAEREELKDGELENDLKPKTEVPFAKDLKPAETTAVQAAVLPMIEAGSIEEELAGIWAADDVTLYQFDEDGTGALILPEHEHAFRWTVDEDELTLKFNSGRIGKAVFRFELEGDSLLLERIDDSGFAEITLEKTAD